MFELPAFGLRAYALLYSRHGASGAFGQRELEWTVSESMRKKIFSLLSKAGWLVKLRRGEYRCVPPEKAIRGLLEFRVPELLEKAEMPYALTGASAVEVWSDYSYVQRGLEKSPYFLKVLKKDLKKWKRFFNKESVPNYVGNGSTVGEFAVLIPVSSLDGVEKHGLKVEPLRKVLKEAEGNYMFSYSVDFIKKKYGV